MINILMTAIFFKKVEKKYTIPINITREEQRHKYFNVIEKDILERFYDK